MSRFHLVKIYSSIKDKDKDKDKDVEREKRRLFEEFMREMTRLAEVVQEEEEARDLRFCRCGARLHPRCRRRLLGR